MAYLTCSLLEQPSVRNALPKVTAEIGDTWIFGVSSDPLKTATMRAMMRQRSRFVRDTKSTNAPVRHGLSPPLGVHRTMLYTFMLQ